MDTPDNLAAAPSPLPLPSSFHPRRPLRSPHSLPLGRCGGRFPRLHTDATPITDNLLSWNLITLRQHKIPLGNTAVNASERLINNINVKWHHDRLFPVWAPAINVGHGQGGEGAASEGVTSSSFSWADHGRGRGALTSLRSPSCYT